MDRSVLVTRKELAEMLGLSVRQIYRLDSAGQLPPVVRLGGAVRYRRQDIQDWLQLGCCSFGEPTTEGRG